MNPSVRSVARTLRDHKVAFDDKALRGWLKPFYRGATAVAPQESSTITAPTPQPHRGFTRAAKVSLVSNPVVSLHSTTTADKPRRVRQGRLEFDLDEKIKRKAILVAVYQRVQPYLSAGTSQADWFRRNSRVASSFVAGRYSPERIVLAWELASKREGEPVRELSLVQRFLDWVATQNAVRNGKAIEA